MLSLRSDSVELSRRSQFSIEFSWVALYIGRIICEQKIVVVHRVSIQKLFLLISAMTTSKNVFNKKPHYIESAKICIKFPNLIAKKGFLNRESINYGISTIGVFIMDGANFTVGSIYALILLTLFLIFNCDHQWENIASVMSLMTLSYLALLISITLSLLVVSKIVIDLTSRSKNETETGMFF